MDYLGGRHGAGRCFAHFLSTRGNIHIAILKMTTIYKVWLFKTGCFFNHSILWWHYILLPDVCFTFFFQMEIYLNFWGPLAYLISHCATPKSVCGLKRHESSKETQPLKPLGKKPGGFMMRTYSPKIFHIAPENWMQKEDFPIFLLGLPILRFLFAVKFWGCNL